MERAFLPVETEAGRLLSRLAPAPIVIVHGAVSFPLAVETLASSGAGRPDSNVPADLGRGPRRRPPRRRPEFWNVARRDVLERVDPGRLRVGRGVFPSGLDPDVVVARGVSRAP